MWRWLMEPLWREDSEFGEVWRRILKTEEEEKIVRQDRKVVKDFEEKHHSPQE
jgi:hypothetical protein